MDKQTEIKLITNESGDYEVLKLDNKIIYTGHSIPNFVWLKLIKDITGIATEEIEISDEDMERDDY